MVETTVDAKKPNHAVLQRTENIIKSEQDKRLYRGLELANHMKVLLASDPSADKSAAALEVNIGSMSDPVDIPGLAHFCEHMLFLGTEKYPIENEYIKFIENHGGTYNASTFHDHTRYFFDIAPDYLRETLDIFSQFFISPLFTESATEREINAVNSEHEGYIPEDSWRVYQLEKHLAKISHPYHRFFTGNKATLSLKPKEKGINVRDEVLKFHNTWYSSNIMCLTVLGKESLDELEDIVVELFSQVKDKDVELPIWPEHPFDEDSFKTYIYVTPVKEEHQLIIAFPSPYVEKYYKAAPTHYLEELIGHGGPGSIMSALKDQGWATSVSSNSCKPARGFDIFHIDIELTEEGLKHVDGIVKLFFQYVNMLKSKGPLEWFQDEYKSIRNVEFRFKDEDTPMNFAVSTVHDIQDIPFEDILTARYLISEWRPDLIEEIWNNFTPEKIRVTVVSKAFENVTEEIEPYYGIKYKLVKINEQTLISWKNAGVIDDLKVPERNQFIPENFDLYPQDELSEHPIIIEDTSFKRVWFKQDNKFLTPKAYATFLLASPLKMTSPLNYNLASIFVSLFSDYMNEYTYSASLAGLSWGLYDGSNYGLVLYLCGFNDKQQLLLEKLMEELTHFKPESKKFIMYKDKHIRSLKGFPSSQPHDIGSHYADVLLNEYSWSIMELLAVAEKVSLENLEAFILEQLSNVHIECLIYGNVTKEKAHSLAQIVEHALSSSFDLTPLLSRQFLLRRGLKLEDGCDYVYTFETNVHRSSCVLLFYQYGVDTKENHAKIELLCQIICEPCFDTLRTKEQLGYSVFTYVERENGVVGLVIKLQSDKHPIMLNKRIETFLCNMLTYIDDMTEEEFIKNKEAIAVRRLEKPKNSWSQNSFYWGEIEGQTYHYDRNIVEVEYLKTLTKKDVIDFYKELLEDNASTRKKLRVSVLSMAADGAGRLGEKEYTLENDDNNICPPKKIDDIGLFKSSHELYPIVQPYLDIPHKGNRI